MPKLVSNCSQKPYTKTFYRKSYFLLLVDVFLVFIINRNDLLVYAETSLEFLNWALNKNYKDVTLYCNAPLGELLVAVSSFFSALLLPWNSI